MKNMERPLGAIFDMDGTLLESMQYWMDAPTECLQKVYGKTPREDLMEHLKVRTIEEGGKWMAQAYDLPDSGGVVARKISALMERHYRCDVQLKAGILRWLDAFRAAGIPMVIATNTDRPLVELALARWNLGGYFSALFPTAEVGAGKDKPDVYEAALRALGTEKARTWVFEDSPFAIKTAKRAGFPVAAVRGNLPDRARAEVAALADFCMDDFAQKDPWF